MTETTIGYIEQGDTAEQAEDRAFLAQETRPRNTAKAPSLLDEFLTAAAADLEKVETFEIADRKGDWSASFNCIITETEIKRYEAKALGKKKDRKDMSQRTLAAYVLAEKNLGLHKGTGPDRKPVEDAEGDPLTFQSDEFREAMDHPNDGFAAILDFLGDAQAITMSSAILREGGWSADLKPLDPTNG